MSKRPLPAGLANALAHAKAPAHATCKDVRDQVAPILQLTANVQKQIAEHRSHLFAAEIAHPDVDGHTERLHQTLRALERDANDLMVNARRVLLSMQQYERYAQEIASEYQAAELAQ